MSHAEPARREASRFGRRVLAVLALAATIVLQGCGEEQQGPPLIPEKGVYQGPADEPLSQEQVDALRERATRQEAQF